MQKQSPNSILAEKIVSELVAQQLIPAEKRIEIARSLETGTLKEADWRLYIDLAIPPTKEEEHEASN